MTEQDRELPQEDPTKKPKAPHREGESMPPKGGESMQPADSRRPTAPPDEGPQGRD